MNKPTVGILSMQRVINYGSFLQAYALRELLKLNGAKDVFFIDIIPGRILVDSPATHSRYSRYARKLADLAKSGNLVSGIKTFLFNRNLTRSITASWPRLGLDRKAPAPLDMVIIGSDEVFNCTQGVDWGYSTQLFGDIPPTTARKVLSYAGSFGYTDIDRLKHYKIDAEVGANLKKLSSISVRDLNSASIVKELTGSEPLIHVDPVLAYGYKKEIAEFRQSPAERPYMIVYSYQDRINDKTEIKAITDFAASKGLELISIFCRYDWCDMAVLPQTPIEVLRWFKFAECIVTDTFHGTIFSIITKSKFATLLRPSNQNKLGYLLSSLNLSDRAAEPSSLATILSSEPDYLSCDSILEQKRQETNRYLNTALSSNL